MRVTSTSIPEVLIIEPKVFDDARGFFYESFNQRVFKLATGLDVNFVQDNHSRSAKGVLRGLHYQIKQPQGKLVRVLRGAVFAVAVDLRKSSSTFGRWVGVELTEANHRQVWVPPGFAHGFLVTSGSADFLYKTTDFYAPEYERCIAWNDPAIGIRWPIDQQPSLSAKDQQGLALRDAETFSRAGGWEFEKCGNSWKPAQASNDNAGSPIMAFGLPAATSKKPHCLGLRVVLYRSG